MASCPTRKLPAPSSDIHDEHEAATAVLRKTPITNEPLSLPESIDSIFERRTHEVIGAYRILREVGAGGMGVVYEAIDLRLKRRAAIKMIRGGESLSRDALRRFQTEAEAVAQTHHPNIVQIYDVGWHDAQPYVALEFLPGGSLHAKVAGKPQSPLEAARQVQAIAGAVQHAHEKGIIHRDLKPANILFTADGTPKVTDFGAARLNQDGADSNATGLALTKVGEVIGTPQYMAPEQARGTPNGATPAIDVYALGALLYHLLTGRPPHDGPDSFDVLNAVVRIDPVAPRRLVPQIPRDLETICLKALEKHPTNRYVSAAAMAEDIGRFLGGESILAKPDPILLRLCKKARRRPLISGLVAGIVIVAVAGLAGIVWQWQQALTARGQAEVEAANTLRESRNKEANLYHSQVSAVALMIDSGDTEKAHSLLTESGRVAREGSDQRHWEWHFLNRLANNHLWKTSIIPHRGTSEYAWSHSVAVSPDGRYVAYSGGNPYRQHSFDSFVPATMVLLDRATGKVECVWPEYQDERAQQLVWRDATTIVTSMHNKGLRVISVPDGQVRFERKPLHGVFTERLSQATVVSPDGRFAWYATAPRMLVLLDTNRGEIVRTFRFESVIRDLPILEQSAENWFITVGTENATVILDPRTGETRLSIPHWLPMEGAIDPEGRRVVLHLRQHDRNQEARVECRSLENGNSLWWRPRPLASERCRLQFHPEGERVAEVYNAGVSLRLLDASTGDTHYELRGHTNRIFDFQHSPDGRFIASASNDGSVRLWDLAAAAEVARLRGHSTGVRAVAFGPDGRSLHSAGMDANAIAWDLTRERPDGTLLPRLASMQDSCGGAFAGGLWIGPDGIARFLDTSFSRLQLFDPSTYTPVGVVSLEGMSFRSEKTSCDYVLSADARRLFGPANHDHSLRLWDTQTGRSLLRFPHPPGRVIAATLSPDGSLAAAVAFNHERERHFLLWNAESGDLMHQQRLDDMTYGALAFDPTGQSLFLGVGSLNSDESGLHVMTVKPFHPEVRKQSFGRKTLIRHIAISPDGRWIACVDYAASANGMKLIVLDATGETPGWTRDHAGVITGLAFSPDGRRLAAARYDEALVIYDTASGREAFNKPTPSNRLGDYAFPARVAFSPDGRSLTMNHSNGQLSVWRTDDWSADTERRAADRRREAADAAFAFHLRGAHELASRPRSLGFLFHLQRLERLIPPNEFSRAEWETLKLVADAFDD